MNDFTDLKERVKHLEEQREQMSGVRAHAKEIHKLRVTVADLLNQVEELQADRTAQAIKIATLEKLHDKPTLTEMLAFGAPKNDGADDRHRVSCHICHKPFKVPAAWVVNRDQYSVFTCADCMDVDKR